MLPERLSRHLSFRGNAPDTRYSWLRLTPAYAHELVHRVLTTYAQPDDVVLPPFAALVRRPWHAPSMACHGHEPISSRTQRWLLHLQKATCIGGVRSR